MKVKIRPIAFYIPVVLFVAACVLNFTNGAVFEAAINNANTWLMGSMGWTFGLGVTAMLVVVVYLMFSKFGDVRLGGRQAAPLLSNFQYFSITLTTVIAVGILMWGAAEPLSHYTAPPESWGIAPNSPQSAIFSISTLYLHWGFTPLAIYAVPTIMFGFAYYNMKKPYSLGSGLVPLLGDKAIGSFGQGIDAVCMYALIAGMATSLGEGILTIAGGLNYLTGIQSGVVLWLIIDIAIVVTFVISSITGLFEGIRKLSEINTWIFIAMIIFIFVVGPTVFILNIGSEAFGDYLSKFFIKSLFTGAAAGDLWSGWWTIFYWCNWLAWAPVSGMFLGRISYGRTIRQVLTTVFIWPAIFDMIWMLIFGAATIHLQMSGVDLTAAMAKGAEYTVYAVYQAYPLAWLTIPVFVGAMFLSFVTGADAYTTTLGGMSMSGLDPVNPDPPIRMKIFWGFLMGTVAWVMISLGGGTAGINGVKMLSNLGGGPALLLELGMLACLCKVAANPSKYDLFKEDYDADGVPLKSVTKPVSHQPQEQIEKAETIALVQEKI